MSPLQRLFGPFVDGWQRMVDAEPFADLGTDEPVPYLPVDAAPGDDLMALADSTACDCGYCTRMAAVNAERAFIVALWNLPVYDPETQR